MTQTKQTQSKRQWGSFALLVVGLGVFSFFGLPALATLSPVKARIELNDAKQINGGATFYTDQPFLEKLLAENELKTGSEAKSILDQSTR